MSSSLPFKSAGAQNVVVLQTLLCTGRGSPVAFETSACGMISWPFIQPLISPSLRQTETHTQPLSSEGSLAFCVAGTTGSFSLLIPGCGAGALVGTQVGPGTEGAGEEAESYSFAFVTPLENTSQ